MLSQFKAYEDETMDAAIEAQDLGISRGRIKANTVIPHMTFGVETGSVTGLLGPSGGGKPTPTRKKLPEFVHSSLNIRSTHIPNTRHHNNAP